MGKINLEIKANMEFVQDLKTCHPDYAFSLRIKCTGCGEVSNKWHAVSESEKFPGKTGRSENNFIAKCKLCQREYSLDIIPGSNASYTSDDSGTFKSIVTFECRGLEPIDFEPGDGWIVKVEDSSKVFDSVDLTEKEWVEYDENIKQSVGIYEFESKFVSVK